MRKSVKLPILILIAISLISLLPFTLSSKISSVPVLSRDAASKIEAKVPKLAKIFDNPSPNDGYESLRFFSSGLTEGLFKKQLYNTSIALTSALFSYQLPSNSDSESTTVNAANQVIFGMFAMLSAVLIFSIPVLLTGTRFNPNARSMEDGEGILDSILKTEPLARLIKNDYHKKIGLEPEKCLKKTICEAHRSPQNKRYGMLAVPFQMFYPSLAQSDDQSRATSYQEAAYDGKYSKTKCEKKYNCFFDVLELGRYLLDWYQYHNGGFPEESTN
ncbi:unnamed protein product [Orchesella dallaii]|uniref:Uncharacterized protein n=1 Tax=Orchesella dallaii TaxID=48710 RepID=A0ABP1QA92_9HEXA